MLYYYHISCVIRELFTFEIIYKGVLNKELLQLKQCVTRAIWRRFLAAGTVSDRKVDTVDFVK